MVIHCEAASRILMAGTPNANPSIRFIVMGCFTIMTAVITLPLLSLSITQTPNVYRGTLILFNLNRFFARSRHLPLHEGPDKDTVQYSFFTLMIFLIAGCKYTGSARRFFKNPQVILLSPP